MFTCDKCDIKEQSNGMIICETCGQYYGEVLMNQWVAPGYQDLIATNDYNANKYARQLFKHLLKLPTIEPSYKRHMYDFCKKKNWKVTWKQLKTEMTKLRFGLGDIYLLPHMLDFTFKIKENVFDMFDLAKKNWPGKHRLNNAYALYQCIRLTGDNAEWFPISFTNTKVKELDMNWFDLCMKMNWVYRPSNIKRYIDFTSLYGADNESELRISLEDGVEIVEDNKEERDAWFRNKKMVLVTSCI